uniref:Eukaryotic translation initiation factor 3 subunit D n=2 Tax=Mesocestoides corti TaxID=53468 RepID=A0A5K3F7W3_MESCO
MSVPDGDLPSFGSLSINCNSDGWGPSAIPDGFRDMPYQPFSKDTRLGKIADWCGSIHPDMKSKNRYVSQFGGGAQYAYYHDEDDSNFQMANAGKDTKSGAFRQRFRFQLRGRGRGYFQQGFGGRGGGQFMSLGNFAGRQRRPMTERERASMQTQQQQRRYGSQANWQQYRRGGNWGGGGNWRQGGDFNRRMNRGNRNPSVDVKDDWNLLEDLEFSQFASLSLPHVKERETCLECGAVKYYDRTFDSINTRSERPLVRFNGVVHAVTTSEDPIIRNLAHKPSVNVFCTDRIAATIMCAPKSVDSWDLLAIRIADKLFFDVRPGSNFDHVTVAETAIDPPMEEPGHINNPEKLALEATFININFSQQVLQSEGNTYNFKQKNPFIDSDDKEEAEKVASVGYRYRQFDLGNGINMVVRCEVDAVMPSRADEEPDKVKFCCIKALNEFDSRYCNGVNWRNKLDTQRGAVIASELKNNSCKLAKWTVASIIAGADLLKFGFVSRVNPKDTSHHVILGTHEFRPTDFASQINLNMDNAWGILRCVIDYFMKCEPGTYLMMKDPNKPIIHIYSLPANAFASDEESDDSSDGQPPAKN